MSASAYVGRGIYRLGGELTALLIALGVIALYLASGLAARQSADLSPLSANFERWFSQSFDGARAEAGDLALTWNPADETVSFTATDVVVYDRDGAVVQTLDRLRATTLRANLLARKAALKDVEIVGGEVTWLRREDGRIIAGLGNPSTVGGFGPVYEGRNEPSDTGLSDWLEAFRSISLVDSRANIVDRRDGLGVRMDIARLDGRRDGSIVELDVQGDIVSNGEVSPISLSLDSEDALQTMRGTLSVEALRPDALAADRGRLAVLRSFQLPVQADLSAIYSRRDGLQSATLDLSADAGIVALAGQSRAVDVVAFSGSLDPGAETMQVETLRIDADRLQLSGSGEIGELGRLYDGDIGTSPQFDLAFSDSTLDLTPVFAAPLRVRRARAVGQLDLDARTLSLDSLSAQFRDFGIGMRAKLVTTETGLSEVTLVGATDAPMTAPDLLSLWPVDSADGARRWIDRAVLGGTLHNVRFAVDLDAAFFAAPALSDERLQLDFDVQDGTVRYISTMTPLTEARGSGRINGNRFGFVLDGGRIGDVEIVGGDIDIPRLTPKGGDILISAQAQGEASDLLALINEPPFEYLDRYGVDPAGFDGQADISLSIRRPLLEYFDEDRITYAVDGTFTDASAPFRLGSVQLTDADVTVTGDKTGLFVSGPANLGPWRADIGWAERYGQDGEPTRYRIEGVLDREALDAFGIGLREVFGGEIGVDIEASGQGLNVTDALIDLDLSRAELSIDDIWSKAIGEAGEMRANLQRSDDGFTLGDLRLRAPGLDLSGSARLTPELALIDAALDRMRVDGLVDGRMSAAPDRAAGRIALDASGRWLDLSGAVQRALQSAGGDPGGLPISVTAAFEEILLAPDYALRDAFIDYRHTGAAIGHMSIKGTRPDGAFDVSLRESEAGGPRAVRLRIPDLSQSASELLGIDAIRGGSLSLSAELPPTGLSGAIIGQARAVDFTLRDAPFLAQILSLASLTGFLDTLSGEGLAFDALDLRFALDARILSVRDARLRGPAIGMTGEGDVSLDDRLIDFGGTLVPSYTANSLLGDIPILGDLLVGGDGEGIFAVTYTVDGPYSQAQITINPLSALTPGFIRGIFREDREALPEGVLAEIESVRPPDPDESDD